MGSPLGRVGLEKPIQAEAFAGGAEQSEQDDRERVQEQQAVASLRIGDAQRAHAHAESEVFGVAETRFDGPSLGVVIDDLAGGRRRGGSSRCTKAPSYPWRGRRRPPGPCIERR